MKTIEVVLRSDQVLKLSVQPTYMPSPVIPTLACKIENSKISAAVEKIKEPLYL